MLIDIMLAIVVFVVYARGGHRPLGFALMAVIMTAATVRQALFTVARLGDPLMYCGLPRTVSGYASIGLVLSRFFFRDAGPPYVAAAVVVGGLADIAKSSSGTPTITWATPPSWACCPSRT